MLDHTSVAPRRSHETLRAALHLLRVPLRFLVLVVAFLTVSRLALLAWRSDRLATPRDVWLVLEGGLRMDLQLLAYASAPAVLAILLSPNRGRTGRLVDLLSRAWFVGWASLILLLELMTPSFVAEYDVRPDRKLVEYLGHPREVGSMLAHGYAVEVAVVLVLATLGAIWLWRWFAAQEGPRAVGARPRLAAGLVVVPALFLGARSSLQHRPANPSSVAFSEDHLLNDLCLSSAYSVAYACYGLKDEADAAEVYGKLDEATVVSEVRSAMVTVPEGAFTSDAFPTMHHQAATAKADRPRNLVIVLEESLGASYVGALGGEPVTRFLDTLRDEGWWFERMYATGTRSVRGIEATVAGFPPTPARSVVKLGGSQHGFYTLASYLGERGYATRFVYGGESHFDNMRRFFTGNGFEEIVDEDDFEDARFHGSWGVCDEDVFEKAHETFLAAGDEPFFALVFSVSNHSPWEFPTEGVELYEEPVATRRNAVRYADHALERFFELARSAPYWEDTVFCVVADHCSRVYGASLVPLEHFHVPAVVLGAGVEPRIDGRVASQLDLPPTLLSLLGVSGEHPMIGHDLTRLPADHPGRAICQYGSNQAYLEGDDALVLQPHLPARQFTWTGGELVPAPLDEAFARRGLAHALLPSMLYERGLYPDASSAAAAGKRRP